MTPGLLVAAFLGLLGTTPPPHSEVAVAPLYCLLDDGSVSAATITRVGDVQITAKHAICIGMEIDYFGPKGSDLVIIQSGSMPSSCSDAEPGEPVLYVGFPGTNRDGEPYDIQPRDPERDVGSVKKLDHPLIACAADLSYCVAVDGVTIGSSRRVRPGYSGGAVVSRVDGRLVGMIVAVASDGSVTYFTPISQICNALEEIS